jgi:CrcB protein
MKIKSFLVILLTCYGATFLRVFINNNLIVSVIGSFFLGFVIARKLSYSKEKIILSGFFSCLTSFSGFIYFLYEIFNEENLLTVIFWFNIFIILNLFIMYFGFWLSRKIT